MARPRKPDDPDRRREIPCDRCGGGYYLVVNWGPNDQICGYCYKQAKRTRGTCACGHVGVLPGRVNDLPACRSCANIVLNIDCVRCGAEDDLYRNGLCWRCSLSDAVDERLTNPKTNAIVTELVPLADALKSMDRANSGLTWIRQKHVSEFLTELATHLTVTHDGIDALPPSRTRDYVRGLLVEHGVLARRDETTIRYQQWAEAALTRLSNDANKAIIDRYVRWHHLRRMNQMDRVSHGTFLRSKQTVTVAINFLNWLDERTTPLEALCQADLDDWVAGGTTTRLIVDQFLKWASKNQLTSQGLKIPQHRRGTSRKLSASDQNLALTEVVDGRDLSARDKAAAILVLVFGQQLERVVALTWDSVSITDDIVTVTLANFEIALTDPLDGPWRTLKSTRGRGQTAAHPCSNWVFLGQSPGQHINAMSLRDRLRGRVFSTRAARLGTLHELTKYAPVAIIAETLGYHSSTIERHATGSAATYARYIESILHQT